ncbi:hypothetical protein EAT49_15455 [Histidinibacterium lentulum]|uniref:Hedgehog/Intein (Hint) domain-containing protein n=2 Tax=Histidinibacterium lentulum TaxID=2480588 RepID=A0A3N2QUV9_9RHOB|nr:hypothetical protein EAT49_15455 [Histidinibacterium lentulum]
MRRYEVMWLDARGDIAERSTVAPALPAFESAFAAFARGTLFSTEAGPVAIEDLLPGDRVRTVDAGFQPVLWRGSTTIVPGAQGQSPVMGSLTRIAADALGIARPMPDLVLGPLARIYHRTEAVQRITRADGAFLPARDLIDGCNVIELTPPSPVQVFHISLAGHHRVVAQGVELESHHPGTLHELGLRGDALALYMSLFPHRADVASFGPMRFSRLRLSDLDLLGVA